METVGAFHSTKKIGNSGLKFDGTRKKRDKKSEI
jgi:hypothetical protein